MIPSVDSRQRTGGWAAPSAPPRNGSERNNTEMIDTRARCHITNITASPGSHANPSQSGLMNGPDRMARPFRIYIILCTLKDVQNCVQHQQGTWALGAEKHTISRAIHSLVVHEVYLRSFAVSCCVFPPFFPVSIPPPLLAPPCPLSLVFGHIFNSPSPAHSSSFSIIDDASYWSSHCSGRG